jgi:hypothetical protein
MVSQAPLSVQARIFQRILQAHPDWAEEGVWGEQ